MALAKTPQATGTSRTAEEGVDKALVKKAVQFINQKANEHLKSFCGNRRLCVEAFLR